MKSYINANGVQVFINPTGVLLSYSQDSEQQIEVAFNSEQQTLQKMNVESLDSITGISLISLAYTLTDNYQIN